MKNIKNKCFDIEYPIDLEEHVKNAVGLAKEKRKYLCNLFDCKEDNIPCLTVKYFSDRKMFEDYIFEVSNGKRIPEWAKACFFKGQIQIYIDINKSELFAQKEHFLAHEMVHLFIDNLIYKKYNIKRIRWFDESYAGFIDGHIKNKSKEEIIEKAKCLSDVADSFDMGYLNSEKNLDSSGYNSYDMFLIIGKYIFDTKQEKILLEMIKNEPQQIQRLGKTVLHEAVGFVLEEKE